MGQNKRKTSGGSNSPKVTKKKRTLSSPLRRLNEERSTAARETWTEVASYLSLSGYYAQAQDDKWPMHSVGRPEDGNLHARRTAVEVWLCLPSSLK